jgi:hypothetical protein
MPPAIAYSLLPSGQEVTGFSNQQKKFSRLKETLSFLNAEIIELDSSDLNPLEVRRYLYMRFDPHVRSEASTPRLTPKFITFDSKDQERYIVIYEPKDEPEYSHKSVFNKIDNALGGIVPLDAGMCEIIDPESITLDLNSQTLNVGDEHEYLRIRKLVCRELGFKMG